MTDQGVIEGRLFIDGEFVDATLGTTFDVINPATEEVIAKVARGRDEDVNLAVHAAKAAFKTWRKTSGAERAVILREIANKVREDKATLARLETINNGKPLPEAEWDVDDVAGCFDFFAGEAEKLETRPVDVGMDAYKCEIRYEPAGVVGAIVPSNYPLLMATWKLAPAMAAGCCVVLKPHELTPLTALRLCSLLQATSLPKGVVNVVTGFGKEVGAPLAEHPRVNKLAFTGSGPTGRALGQIAAAGTKAISLELGGKSPVVVYDDIENIDRVVEWVMFGCFWTNGQICSATSRLILHSAIAPRFLEKLVLEAKRIYIAKDPLEPTARLGPLVSKAALDKALRYIEGAVSQGAELLCGGQRPATHTKGFFLEPTILKVKPGMTIWKEEVFAPVLSVVLFDTDDEAIKLANDTEYGLGSAVFSQSEERLDRFSDEIQAGIVWRNCSQPCFSQLPWGGVKASGTSRELGPWGLHNYLEQKTVVEHVAKARLDWYSFTDAKL